MPSSQTDARGADPLLGEIVLLLRKIVYAPEGSITPETVLSDLGLDSLDLIEAGLELEALLGRDLPEASLRDVRTVGDLAQCFRGTADSGRLLPLAA
jgi:acyl carrier protein